MACLVDTASKVARSCTVAGFAGDKNECKRGRFKNDRGNLEETEEDGQNEGIDARMRSTGIDEVGLEVTIPEEAVIRLRTSSAKFPISFFNSSLTLFHRGRLSSVFDCLWNELVKSKEYEKYMGPVLKCVLKRVRYASSSGSYGFHQHPSLSCHE